MKDKTFFEMFLYYRRGFLTLGNIIGAFICIYFIYHVQEYNISFNLLSSFFPSAFARINSFLHIIGTYILIIPLTIIILTFLIPEHLPLRVVGSFFGISSTLIVLFSGFWKGTLHQIYNMKLFIVCKILTLDEKRQVFKEHFSELVFNQYGSNTYMWEFQKLMALLSDKYFIEYDIKLRELVDAVAVMDYAKLIFSEARVELTKLMLTMNNQVPPQTASDKGYVKILIIFGVIMVSCVVIRYLWENQYLTQLAELVKGNAELGAKSADNITKGQELGKEATEALTDLSLDSGIVIGTKLSNAAELAFNKFGESLELVKARLDRTGSALNDLADVVDNHLSNHK